MNGITLLRTVCLDTAILGNVARDLYSKDDLRGQGQVSNCRLVATSRVALFRAIARVTFLDAQGK